jgi:hypothetical protein
MKTSALSPGSICANDIYVVVLLTQSRMPSQPAGMSYIAGSHSSAAHNTTSQADCSSLGGTASYCLSPRHEINDHCWNGYYTNIELFDLVANQMQKGRIIDTGQWLPSGLFMLLALPLLAQAGSARL